MKRRLVAFALGTGLVGVAIGACVLADPPATLPVVAESPPAILAGVTPPPGFLATWPDRFYIPVSVLDPAQPLKWLAYEDYNPFTSGGTALPLDKAPVTVSSEGDGGVRTIVIAVLGPPTGPGCHTIEVVVASAFDDFVATDPPGGVVVGWTYTRSGSPGDCMPFDAGAFADGTFPDAGRGDAGALDGGI
jgi:hypothetical protein